MIRTEDDVEIVAQIDNESYGGLGLVCEDASALEEGQSVAVTIDEAEYDAVIVSLRPLENNATHVGIKWLEEEESEEEFFED